MKASHALISLALGIVISFLLTSFLSVDIALFFGFVIAAAGVIYSDRHKVKRDGVVLMRRTQKGKNFIDRVARLSPNGWRIAANIGVVLGVIAMVGGSIMLVWQAYEVSIGAVDGGVKLLLPGPVSAPVNAPGVFVVPWWIWVIGIAIVIIPHEFMHGIMCRIDKVRIKSVGWALFLVIPGAFVEPDEAQLKKSKKMTKLRVYAAGSFANLIVGALIIVAFFLFLSPAVAPAGVFVALVEGGPAYNASLNGTIVTIDNNPILTREDLTFVLSQYNPGDTVMVTTAKTEYVVSTLQGGPDFFIPKPAAVIGSARSTYQIKLSDNEGRAFLGVAPIAQGTTLSMDPNVYSLVSTLLLWMFLFSFGIGIVNMLPIGPLDGGQFFGELVNGRKRLIQYTTAIMVALLLFNLIGPILL